MSKKYKLPEEEDFTINEPAISYTLSSEITSITDEELKECITSEELIEYMHEHIDKLFDK